MKRTVIEYERVVTKDGRKIKITGWDNIYSYEDLPTEYVENGARYYLPPYQSNGFFIVDDNNKETVMRDAVMDVETFNHIIQVMKKAGDRLYKINKKLRRLKKSWNGVGNIII